MCVIIIYFLVKLIKFFSSVILYVSSYPAAMLSKDFQ